MVMEADLPIGLPADEAVREKLRVARPGLRFSEVMTGMITMGIKDPVEGYQNDAAIAMQLHATVTLPNLPGFIKDLTGGVERFAHRFCCLVIKHRTQFSFIYTTSKLFKDYMVS